MIRKCSECGATWKFSKIDLIKLLFKDKFYYNCKDCGSLQCYKMVRHLVHDNTDNYEKAYNKWLKDCRRRLYKNG